MMIASKAHSDDPAGTDTGDERWDLGGETLPTLSSWGSGGESGQWESGGDSGQWESGGDSGYDQG